MSIFVENISYRPFTYPWAVEAEKKQRVEMHWHENQIEFQDDLRQFSNKGGLATKNVSHETNKNLVEKLSMVFTEMDVAVGAGYAQLLPYAKNNEIRCLWFTYGSKEVTHQRNYAMAAEEFGFTNSDWSKFKEYTEMADKIDLMTQRVGDLSKPLNFAKMLSVVFLGEGISLFGAFACLLNLKRFGLMLNFNNINEWSLKDEQEHVINNMRIFDDVRKELFDEENAELNEWLFELVGKYVSAEHRYLDLVFEMGDQEDLSLGQAKDFLSYLGELRLYQLGLLTKDEVRKNPLPWIDYMLSGSTHSNFFETRVVDYTHNGLEGEIDYSRYANVLELRKQYL